MPHPTGNLRFPTRDHKAPNMPQKTARVVHPDGSEGRLKIKRIREHQAVGAGVWNDGVFIFAQVRKAAIVTAPRPVVSHRHIKDSGQYGFLRYPMPWGPNSHAKFPGLSRQGAGL